MRQDLTEIVLVVDRSGSMESCRSDAEGGVNTLIEEQKKGAGEARLTLVQFDTEYEFVHQTVPIKDVPRYALIPRGGTALLDAVGKAIAQTGERLKALPEDQRPGLVVFVIVTDGQENSSREYSKAAIKKMIEEQQTKWKWQFTFLGANQDAFAEAGGLGIPVAAAAMFVPGAIRAAYAAASSNVGRMRVSSVSGQCVSNRYTAEEIKAMAEEEEEKK
jgi:uncharacterized protein YegL